MSDFNAEFLPHPGTIVLGPTGESGIWELTFTSSESGEEVRVLLPRDELREMAAEFTGVKV